MKQRKIEFSKIIAIVILSIFSLTFIVAWLVYIFKGEVNNDLLNYVSTPLMVVVSGYFTKSGIENITKIKEPSTDTVQEFNIQ